MASDVHRSNGLFLLGPADPPPVIISNAEGSSPFLLIGDHAGNAIPSALGDLGLSSVDRKRHIAWDIGVAGLGDALAGMLDAAFVRQVYSRLVVDCNRGIEAQDAIAGLSDGSRIPGNLGISHDDRAARFSEIHEPYHRSIASELDRRAVAGRPTILIALHSFTPCLAGGSLRPWQIGVLHDGGDTAFALALLAALRGEGDLVVGDNEPYAMNGIDYTVPRHAYARGMAYAELEIRQDLLDTMEKQAWWARRMARILRAIVWLAPR